MHRQTRTATPYLQPIPLDDSPVTVELADLDSDEDVIALNGQLIVRLFGVLTEARQLVALLQGNDPGQGEDIERVLDEMEPELSWRQAELVNYGPVELATALSKR